MFTMLQFVNEQKASERFLFIYLCSWSYREGDVLIPFLFLKIETSGDPGYLTKAPQQDNKKKILKKKM